jgi:hypothetical protein
VPRVAGSGAALRPALAAQFLSTSSRTPKPIQTKRVKTDPDGRQALNTANIPVKTPDGLAELNTRKRRLSQRHRTLLLFVDGRRGEAQVRAMGAQAGVPDTFFSDLLAFGLIEMREPTSPSVAPGTEPSGQRGEPAWQDDPVTEPGLPAMRTLPPASGFLDSATGQPAAPSSWFQTDPMEQEPADAALEHARELLLRTLRAEAPLAGSLTSLRLWRARSREDLQGLLDEVEARVGQRRRSLSVSLALQQARTLLTGPRGLAWTSR